MSILPRQGEFFDFIIITDLVSFYKSCNYVEVLYTSRPQISKHTSDSAYSSRWVSQSRYPISNPCCCLPLAIFLIVSVPHFSSAILTKCLLSIVILLRHSYVHGMTLILQYKTPTFRYNALQIISTQMGGRKDVW